MNQHIEIDKQHREDDQTRKREHMLQLQQALAEISLRAIQTTDLQLLMDESLHLVCDVLNISNALVLEALPEQDVFRIRSGFGWQYPTEGSGFIGAQEDTQPGYTFHRGDTVVQEDTRADSRFVEIPLLTQNQIVSGVTTLIPGRTLPYGVLSVYHHERRSFTIDEVHFLKSAANTLASAIERKKAEQEIRVSHDRLSVILQSAADGITVQDQDGKLIYANDAAARAVGYETAAELLCATPEEIIGKFDMFQEDGSPLPVEMLPGRQVQRGASEAQSVVGFRIRATGEKRWSFVKARPVPSTEGSHIQSVSIFQDITDLKHNEEAQRFIAEAGKIFSSSLDYQTTLQNVAELAAHSFADWCTITVLEDNQLKNMAVAHVNPQRLKLVREMEHRYPADLDDPASVVAKVIKSGQPAFFQNISAEALKMSPRGEDYIQLTLSLGIRSAIVLPLIAGDRTLGALSLVWAESGRTYTERDVELAEELCRRAAIAIDNARLFREVQQSNTLLEQRVQQRTDQLQTLVLKLRSEIAERKKAQEELVQNETMLEGLFDAAPDATLLVNSEGLVMRANAQTENMFGFQRDQLIGKPVDNLFPLRFRYVHKNYRQRLLSDPALRQDGGGVELYARRSDGSEFPVDVVLSPVQTKDGLQTISAIRDVTRRKVMEAELAEVQRRLIDSLEAERLLLAQEIHDGAIQELYGLSYAIKGLEDTLTGQDPDPAGAQEFLVSSKESLQQAIAELRSISGELRPPTLAPFGLEKAILAHIEQVREKHSELDVHPDLMPDNQLLPEHMRMALYRIYQHAVSNVVRHAQAKNLWIKFAINSEHILMEIKDDGVGFNLPSRWVELAREGHLGLIGTAERAEAVGAQLNINSEPGHGTTIQVLIPQGKPLEPEMRATNWLLHRKQ